VKILKDEHAWPKLAVYDIEATEWVNVFLVCHIDEYGNRAHFRSISEYVDFLFSERCEATHVWAHFGGRYDHRFLIPEFYRRGWDFRAALSGGSIVILAVTDDRGRKMQFADSFRLMPNALAAIGKTIKLEKLDVDRGNLDRERFEGDPLYREEVTTYCYRDCEIVMRGLQYMRDVLTAVNADFAFTLASIATRWVRRSPAIDFNRFYRPKQRGGGIEYDPKMRYADYWCEGLDRPPNQDDKTVFDSFHGGRTEMFEKGIIKGPVYYYDVVSSYPWSMTNELPLYYDGFHSPPKNPSPSEIERFLSYTGVTEASVYVPACPIGPLAYQREDYPLIFPTGAFEGRFTNVELLAAYRRGVRIELGMQCRFESKAFLSPFVNTFYNLRRKAKADKDEFRTYAFKILLNSLYGKLTETVQRTAYTTSKAELEHVKESGGTYSSTKIAGLYSVHTEEEGPFRHVAAGAYVTAYSRLKLLEGMEYVLRKGGRVYYCDTDSIMSSIPLPELEGKELGEWQPEYVFDEVEILLPKVYKATVTEKGTTIYRCKGLPIRREKEPEDIPERRWQAFKLYAQIKDDPSKRVEAAEMASLLMRDGISGFVADMNVGSISPRHLPLLRMRQSNDRKRDWSVSPSQPLNIDLSRKLKVVR
jgi:DNA polymerase type B, organellar and viral